jgi:hypothetical protein
MDLQTCDEKKSERSKDNKILATKKAKRPAFFEKGRLHNIHLQQGSRWELMTLLVHISM